MPRSIYLARYLIYKISYKLYNTVSVNASRSKISRIIKKIIEHIDYLKYLLNIQGAAYITNPVGFSGIFTPEKRRPERLGNVSITCTFSSLAALLVYLTFEP